jgi:PAS domain S-box-containing protein
MLRSRHLPQLAAVPAAALALALPTDALALGAMLANLGGIDSKERLWLAAFGGLSLGIAFGLFAFELRSRSLAVAVRRLTDLVVGMDGRFAEHSRESASRELARLSDELMFAAQRAARERRESERRMGSWEALFAAAFDGMFALDAAGRITYINPAAERLFKVKADEATGQLLSDVMLPPTHRSPDNAAFASDLATGKAQGRTQELVAQRSDGRQFPVEVSIAEFGSGETRGFVAIARDISQVRRSRAELKRVRAQAAVAENELREQVAVLKKARVTPPVVTAADHARVVAPSPVAAHAPTPPARAGTAERTVSFTLEEACGDAIRRLAGRAERLGLGFRYEDGELHGVVLRGDPARLRRVLVSLVDSVVRVTEVGEVIVHLRTAAGEGREIQLTADVTATAMTDAQAAKMLKPFVNATVTRHGGTGYPGRVDLHQHIDFLGTAVAHEVVPGAGATFRFQLKLSALPSTPATSPMPATRASGSDQARLHQEFLKSAARLRRNAETAAMMALWAEAHRLKDVWKRHGGRDEIGLVTALAHTARGGDATNAVVLARRLADALEEAARVSSRHAVRA